MTQVLTIKTVKRKALEAYKAGKLTAQHRVQSKRICVFELGNHHCAVGAALSKKTIKAIHKNDHNQSTVNCIAKEGYVSIGDDKGAIETIQRTHDDWASHSREFGAKSQEAITYRAKFLEAIAA